MSIQIQSEGRRHYIVGNTYPIKDQLRSAGAKWDPDRKAWWTGKLETAQKFVSSGSGIKSSATESSEKSDSPKGPGEDGVVAGKAEYEGKTYYLAGRVQKGRTHWDDRVDAIVTRDGRKYLLYYRDGSNQFWAERSGVRVVKSYEKPMTIGRIKRFAEDARRNGGIHPNACPNCGSTSCSAAYGRGGLCDED